MSQLLNDVRTAVKKAGDEILKSYDLQKLDIDIKDDNSPLTQADISSHDVLFNTLKRIDNIPVLSEEGAKYRWSQRKNWIRYWLIDPLDGTKEFINRNGEFTVNVALIESGVPILGVVYAPLLNLWYYAETNKGAYRQLENDPAIQISTSMTEVNSRLRVVGSRSHSSVDFNSFIKQLPNYELKSVGSSLKICMVADGSADIYPRLIPTFEWDTAAAHIVLQESGGIMCTWPSCKELVYNKDESLLNPYFLACSSKLILDFIVETID